MPAKQPSYEVSISGGLSFVNHPTNSNYRALRLDSTEKHLYWESTYQNILRLNKEFSDFFPNAEFAENGDLVTFTKYINSVEVLAKSRPMRPGESINRFEWQRFLNSWQSFKTLAEQPDVPEDIVRFVKTFGPPPFDTFPSAYRIYKPHWYSNPQLIMLWGFEPASSPEIPKVYDTDVIISQIERQVESEASPSSFNFLRLIKFFVIGLVAFFLLLLILWLLIPMPFAHFQLSPKVGTPTKISNTSQLSTPKSNYGITSYAWIIEKGAPNESNEFEPVVTWESAGSSKVTLEARRSILWGLLYKKDEKTKMINVIQEPGVVEPPAPFNPLPEPQPAPPLIPVPDVPNPELKLENPQQTQPNGSQVDGKKNDDKINPDLAKNNPKSEPFTSLPNTPEKPTPGASSNSKPIEQPKSNPELQAPKLNTDRKSPHGDTPKVTPLPETPGGNDLGKNGDRTPKNPIPKDPRGAEGTSSPKSKSLLTPNPEKGATTPQIKIISQSIVSDGSESQKIDFSVDADLNIELVALSIDGSDVDFKNTSKTFTCILKKGKHRLELSYLDLGGNSDTIIQEINVDSRPDNQLTPPIKKFKQSDLEIPEQSPSKPPEDNFNKKLA
jgi:hypothetical protein